MKRSPAVATSVPEYIAAFPREVQTILKKLRSTIRAAAPDAEETIKYGIPTMVLNGNVVSYAAYRNHIGVYPAPAGNAAFQRALAPYRSAKHTAKFPLDKPIPFDLIAKLMVFRVKEHRARVAGKSK